MKPWLKKTGIFLMNQRYRISGAMLGWYSAEALLSGDSDLLGATSIGWLLMLNLHGAESLITTQRDVLSAQRELITLQQERLELHDIVTDTILGTKTPGEN